MTKTNAMRMLDKAKIPYETFEYEFSDDELIGLHAAAQIKTLTPAQCFKTLVTRGEKKGILVFCVPVTAELDLKAAAASAGDKRVEMIHVKELFGITGYIRGGCSPIGMKKKYPTFIDSTALDFGKIAISGGQRGLQIILAPRDLIEFVGASPCSITKQYDLR